MPMKSKPLQASAALLAAALSSCGYTTTNEIPPGHPRSVVLTQDLLLRRNPLRDRQEGSIIEDSNNPPWSRVKRGTRITFDALLCEKFSLAHQSYLLCRTHEASPQTFEYFVGERCKVEYIFRPPWDMPAGHPFMWVRPEPGVR